MKSILMCLVHFGSENRKHFLQLLTEYNDNISTAYDLDIQLFLTEDVDYDSQFPNLTFTKHLYTEAISNRLPYEHKAIMLAGLNGYDYYLYSEDDIFITRENVDTFMEVQKTLPSPYVCGFARYELKPNNPYKFLFDLHPAHSGFRGGSQVVKERLLIGEEEYLEPYNLHQGSYLVSNDLFNLAIQNGYTKDLPWYANGPMESVATNIYWNCGLTKVLPRKYINKLTTHHLGDRYVNWHPEIYNEDITPNDLKLSV